MREKIYSFAFFYLIAWCISPPLSYGTIYRLLALAVVLGIFGCQLFAGGFKVEKRQVAILALMVYVVIVNLFTKESFSHRIGLLIVFALALMTESTQTRLAFKKMVWLIPATFILCIVWNLCTLNEIQSTPNIMRLLAKNTATGPSYAAKGVGGYGYMYTVLLIIPIGIDYMLKKENKLIWRIVAAVFVVTSYSLAFESQYFMAMLLAVFIPFAYLTLCMKQHWAKTVAFLLVLLCFTLIYMNAERIIKFLIDSTEGNWAIKRKYQDIYDVLQGDRIANTEFSVRAERYVNSAKYAITHPFFGGLTYAITGNHSTILDIFAQYGFPIGTFMIYQAYLHPLLKGKIPVSRAILVCFVILAFLNVIPFAVGSVLYILLPVYEYRKKEEST